MNEEERKDYPVNIEDIMHTAYLQYSLSVNVGRAIPDARDGLKPGNRRILYAMHTLNLGKGSQYTKSAKVVGEVIGNYHPHGDAAVYDTMVRMAQDFAMRAPLVDGQGNFGSIDGDPAAAYRYTECRMERLAEELLADIDKNTVDMLPTFDEKNLEPAVMPAKYPNLLVNGTTGIGVGMATNIPPHNLREIINATIMLLEKPTATTLELMEVLPGPDFPTGATIRGTREIFNLYETGRGVLRIRSKANIIEMPNGQERIIVTEIPYATNKENLVKKIADLVNEKKLTGISALRDETSRRVGIRIVIEIKRNAMANIVLNQLFAHTGLESSFGCIMLVVDHNRPRVMSLRQLLQAYIDHRLIVVTRRAQFELDKALARAHILEGLLIAVANIDEVVKIIRESRDRAQAADTLKARFGLSDLQTKAILEMRLHQLTGLAIDELRAEHEALMKVIEHLRLLLASRQMLLDLIKTELIEVREKYGDPRRTEISQASEDFEIADLIARHSCFITISNSGYVKRVPADTYQTQRRGGKGVIGMGTKEEDVVEHLFNADSHDLIFFFTSKGRMHWLNVYEIPEGDRTSKGKAIINLIDIEPGEQIRAMITVGKDEVNDDSRFIIMATRQGTIKKTALSAFKNLRKIGIKAIVIEEDDDLIEARLTTADDEVVLSTAKGMACRFPANEVRPMGRVTRGVTGIRFKIPGDYVVSMEIFPCGDEIGGEAAKIETEVDGEATAEVATPAAIGDAAESTSAQTAEIVDATDNEELEELEALGGGPEILVVTSGGMGKRSLVNGYRRTHRGARGVVNIRLKETSELVVDAIGVETDDEIMITTQFGQMVRTRVDEVRTVGRSSMGVRVIRFKKPGDTVVAVTKVVPTEGDEDKDTDTDTDAPDGLEAIESTAETVEADAVQATAESDEAETES